MLAIITGQCQSSDGHDLKFDTLFTGLHPLLTLFQGTARVDVLQSNADNVSRTKIRINLAADVGCLRKIKPSLFATYSDICALLKERGVMEDI